MISVFTLLKIVFYLFCRHRNAYMFDVRWFNVLFATAMTKTCLACHAPQFILLNLCDGNNFEFVFYIFIRILDVKCDMSFSFLCIRFFFRFRSLCHYTYLHSDLRRRKKFFCSICSVDVPHTHDSANNEMETATEKIRTK